MTETRRQWFVLLGLALGLCVTNGFARFAYGLLLPAMKLEAGWTYTQSGWLNTVNAIGYIFGAVFTAAAIGRVSPSRLFVAGFATCSVGLVITGLNAGFAWQTIWRFLVGFFGAMSFSTAATLAAQLFRAEPKKNALAIAILFGVGGGSGVVFAGAFVPLLLARLGPSGWPWGWIILGGVSLLFAPMGIWAARRCEQPPASQSRSAALPIRRMLPEFVGYASFGLGYFVFFTFLGVWMAEADTSPGMTALTWTLLGVCLCVSPFLWRPILARFATGAPLSLILAGTALGSVAPLLAPGPIGLILSAWVFGSSVFMAPGAVTAFARQNLSPDALGRAVSLFTVVFAVAQTLGPVGAGWIGDATGWIGYSLIAAASVLLAGAVIAAFQPELAASGK